jgi:lipopolysaccharide/colanic/teichoic acid biosynthesis glycosyltransferase
MMTMNTVSASLNPDDVSLGDRQLHERHVHVPMVQLPITVPAYFGRKAIWMRLLAGVLLIAFAPMILLAMLLVRLTSAGPALLRQTRLGRDCQPFDVLKIRTMYSDAEDFCGPVLCQPSDSRITPVGRFLRLFHWDELPQLINVVRGEMCLVGPRPERPEIVKRNRLNLVAPGFAERTRVLPGITGLAQINLPADLGPESVIPKVQLDIEYIENANANLDLRILSCTAMRMLGVRHGRAVAWFGLSRSTTSNRNPVASHEARAREAQFHQRVQGRQHRPDLSPAALNCPSCEGVSGSVMQTVPLSDELDSARNDSLDTGNTSSDAIRRSHKRH